MVQKFMALGNENISIHPDREVGPASFFNIVQKHNIVRKIEL
jgi:hypothetical protein